MEASAARSNKKRDLAGLLAFVVVCLGIGALGGIATASSVETWYQTLQKPPFNPPDWVFAPVWTTLYILIGVSGWLVWRRVGFAGAKTAFQVYAAQLVLNLAWSFLFFGAKALAAALIEVVVLLISIIATIILFRSHHRGAALLLVPYALWVSFASLLTASIWYLN
jgi:benzodiazapine receptor